MSAQKFQRNGGTLYGKQADFEGCTLKTMNALKKYAAPEKRAKQSVKRRDDIMAEENI